jgi:hypothetical protein
MASYQNEFFREVSKKDKMPRYGVSCLQKIINNKLDVFSKGVIIK